MNSTTLNGARGVRIACSLWPELKLTTNGGWEDKRGVDGRAFGVFGTERVQVKYDSIIAKTGNIYHELYEKTKGHIAQLWRASAHSATWYIFTTDFKAWRVHVDVLAQVEVGLKLTRISDTSIGFLIPSAVIEKYGCEVRDHGL